MTEQKIKSRQVDSNLLGGWVSDTNTWSYSSADAPTFIISINADMTGILSAGMRLKLTQTTVKYFIVTAVGSYSGGVTLVTVYGGTDYTLANAAISSTYYSSNKAPIGFPLDPSKWTVSTTDTRALSQANPVQNTWYNMGSLSISVPIGCWYLSYDTNIGIDKGSAGEIVVSSTLSTANNTESDPSMTGELAGLSIIFINGDILRSCTVNLATKTSYYLNVRTIKASMADLYRDAYGNTTTIISATCAYL